MSSEAITMLCFWLAIALSLASMAVSVSSIRRSRLVEGQSDENERRADEAARQAIAITQALQGMGLGAHPTAATDRESHGHAVTRSATGRSGLPVSTRSAAARRSNR